jgi:hypothetical protein
LNPCHIYDALFSAYKYIESDKKHQISVKIGCKTYFFSCTTPKNALSLQPLTKQHNLFYTLKKLIPIINAVLCEKFRVCFFCVCTAPGRHPEPQAKDPISLCAMRAAMFVVGTGHRPAPAGEGEGFSAISKLRLRLAYGYQ